MRDVRRPDSRMLARMIGPTTLEARAPDTWLVFIASSSIRSHSEGGARRYLFGDNDASAMPNFTEHYQRPECAAEAQSAPDAPC